MKSENNKKINISESSFEVIVVYNYHGWWRSKENKKIDKAMVYKCE